MAGAQEVVEAPVIPYWAPSQVIAGPLFLVPPHLPHTEGGTFDGWGWVGTKGADELGACPHGRVSVQRAMALLLVRMICWTEDVAQ